MKFSSLLVASLANAQFADEIELDEPTSNHNFTKQELAQVRPRSNGGSGEIQSVVVDPQTIEEYDRYMDLLVEQLFPKLKRDKDYKAHQKVIRNEDKAICQAGFDAKDPLKKVSCGKTRNGDLAPVIDYWTPGRKFKQVKILVLWLQDQVEFGRYCLYGCHCMPEGQHNLIAGGTYGIPVDNIDRACKNFFQCYECAKMQNDKCDGDRVKYKYSLDHNKVTDEKSITCLNPEGTCARNICECDKRWSVNLGAHQHEFNPVYHATRSKELGPGFEWVKDDKCHKTADHRFGRPETCCGDTFPDVMPLQKGKECCGAKTFIPDGQRQCCPGDKIRSSCRVDL